LRRLNLMFDKTPFGSTTNIIFLFSSPWLHSKICYILLSKISWILPPLSSFPSGSSLLFIRPKLLKYCSSILIILVVFE
jgi:hypothetical protein